MFETILGVFIGATLTIITSLIIEKYKNEINLAHTTYDKYIDTILNYYSNIYWFYRICADVVNATVIDYPEGKRIFTRDTYVENLDLFIENYNKFKGYIRLLFPKHLREKDLELLQAFNKYRDNVIKNEHIDSATTKLFQDLHNKKEAFEIELRKYLRTEKILKGKKYN